MMLVPMAVVRRERRRASLLISLSACSCFVVGVAAATAKRRLDNCHQREEQQSLLVSRSVSIVGVLTARALSLCRLCRCNMTALATWFVAASLAPFSFSRIRLSLAALAGAPVGDAQRQARQDQGWRAARRRGARTERVRVRVKAKDLKAVNVHASIQQAAPPAVQVRRVVCVCVCLLFFFVISCRSSYRARPLAPCSALSVRCERVACAARSSRVDSTFVAGVAHRTNTRRACR